jgi:hypothetical protein
MIVATSSARALSTITPCEPVATSAVAIRSTPIASALAGTLPGSGAAS